MDISKDKVVTAMNREEGLFEIQAKAIILAMGCRERPRGALNIPGYRPAGIFSAGTAQRLVNMEGYLPGREVVILGSGDIGLIMARRMTLEGAHVKVVAELMPYSGGLKRNIVQCLNDYDIPLYLSHTIIDVQGQERVEKAIIARVDEQRKPIAGTEVEFDCDTILLSVGLIPENELSKGANIDIDPRTGGAIVADNMETSVTGIFACGNVVHVHDLVDFVTQESLRAGEAAAIHVKKQEKVTNNEYISINNGDCVTYTVPQKINKNTTNKLTDIFFRVNKVMSKMKISIVADNIEIAAFKREHLAPGEMECIKIPKVILDKITTSDITISIKEGTNERVNLYSMPKRLSFVR